MRIAALSLVAALLAAGIAQGQQQVPGGLPATTVQLPSFSIFSVNTTVSVPDRGGMYLGGVNRARDGSRSRGLGNRAIGSDRAANGVQVLATIHNMDELDRAVLAKAAAKRGALDPAVAQAELLRPGVGAAAAGGDSIVAIRAQKAAAADASAKEAAEQFAKAETAAAEGKTSVARIYYQMVARRDVGELKRLAESRLMKLASQGGSVAKR
jgi:hypothetical protein